MLCFRPIYPVLCTTTLISVYILCLPTGGTQEGVNSEVLFCLFLPLSRAVRSEFFREKGPTVNSNDTSKYE